MSTPFYNRVQKLRKRYPQSRSAVLPALRLAQEEHGGWLPSEALREVADALDETPAYLVSNADESEPGAFKDRDVMGLTPHRLLEGCLITAHGIESTDVFIYIRGEYLHEYDVLVAAL